MKPVIMTPEEQRKFRGKYIIFDSKMVVPVGELINLNKEEFRAYWADDEGWLVELTADDFEWYDPEKGDYDFAFTEDKDCIEREYMPKDLVKFLDAVIKERIAAKQDNN